MKTYKITSSYYNDNNFHYYDWDDQKIWPVYDVVAEHEDEVVEAETLDDAYIQFISSHADCFNEKGQNVLWVGGICRLNVSREHSEFMLCAVPGYYFETEEGWEKPECLADVNRLLIKQAEDRKVVKAQQEKERKEEQERIRKERQAERNAMKFTIGSMIDFSVLGY